jgi:hypothetical protein
MRGIAHKMPPVKDIEGLDKTLKTLKDVHNTVYKQMNMKIDEALQIIQKDAQRLIPNTPPTGLSNWAEQASGTMWYRLRWNPSQMANRIKTELGKKKSNRKGFVNLYSVVNASAPAMVYEVAGSRNPDGRPHWKSSGLKGSPSKRFSVSDNPKAGKHFIEAIERDSNMVVRGKTGGRIVRAAGMRNDRQVREKIYAALEEASRITYTKLPNLRG